MSPVSRSGCTTWICFHADSAESPMTSTHPSSSFTPQHLEVLLLAASSDTGLLCERVLKESGFEIHWELAGDESEFSALLSKRCFQMVLAEQSLPGWNGLEALAFLRNNQS